MRYLLYPIFGAVVVIAYTAFVVSGFEPFGASEDRRVMPPEMRGAATMRGSGVFWRSGFPGGK